MHDPSITSLKNNQIRKIFYPKTGKWYFSVVDAIGITGISKNPRNYWKVYKNRLITRGDELVTYCYQLKLQARDGKFYLTDVADLSTITEILRLLAPKSVLVFRSWALHLEKPKNKKIERSPLRKMPAEISLRKKDKSYPQQKTYTLAYLINKKK